jgi:N utilization substance protein B
MPAGIRSLNHWEQMARRSKAREVALQLAYEIDRNPDATWQHIREFVAQRLADPALQQFACELVEGVRTKREELDQRVGAVAHNWTVGRMTPIDRSILRLGSYELLFRGDVPPKTAIDEAIELAKRYGTHESSRFVNGILDRIMAQRPADEPAGPDLVPVT